MAIKLAPGRGGTTATKGWQVGAELRKARERQGWDLPAVAAGLRIKPAYLTAIEEGRLADLPGHNYALGFLRIYANALRLDPDEVSRRVCAATETVRRRAEQIPGPLHLGSAKASIAAPGEGLGATIFRAVSKMAHRPERPLQAIPAMGHPVQVPVPPPWRGTLAGAVAMAGVALAIAAFVGWYLFLGPDREAARAVPKATVRLAETTRGGAAGAAFTSYSPSTLPVPPAAAATPPAAAAMSRAVGQPAGTGLAAASEPTHPQAAGRAAPVDFVPPEPVPPPAPAKPETPLQGHHKVVLRATTGAWVEVREKQGRVLLDRVMRRGETWPVPAQKPDLLISSGNAGGTELIVDGVKRVHLGSSGALLEDLPLDSALIRRVGVGGHAAPPGSTARPAAR